MNPEALARALDHLSESQFEGWLKIAVWHHPVRGPDAIDDAFLERLAVQAFKVCLHGHVHQAIENYHRYDDLRRLHVIGAGTFGAPSDSRPLGIPLGYNVLTYDRQAMQITVSTRKREKPHGAWCADARWGDKNKPQPSYVVDLQ